jgi:peroxiredoxin
VFCWEHAAALAKAKPELDAAGVLLVVVAVGTPASALEFAERLPFPAENLYVDPERALYRALTFHGDLDGSEGMFFDPKVVEGVRRLFFTKVTGERIKERGTDGIKVG